MTREWLQDAIEFNYDGDRGRSQFLPWCWVPRGMYERFQAKQKSTQFTTALPTGTRRDGGGAGHRIGKIAESIKATATS